MTSDELRRVAGVLRAFAREIDALPFDATRRAGGGDTWLGPGPYAFVLSMEQHTRVLRWHVDDLAATAARLEHEAAVLDAPVAGRR